MCVCVCVCACVGACVRVREREPRQRIARTHWFYFHDEHQHWPEFHENISYHKRRPTHPPTPPDPSTYPYYRAASRHIIVTRIYKKIYITYPEQKHQHHISTRNTVTTMYHTDTTRSTYRVTSHLVDDASNSMATSPLQPGSSETRDSLKTSQWILSGFTRLAM